MRTCGLIKSNMSAVPAVKFSAISLPAKYTVPKTRVVDLGRDGACVSFTMTEILQHLFKTKNSPYTNNYKYFYNKRENKAIPGMTVLEAMLEAKREKLINKYAKIQDPDTLKYTIYHNGPCAICLPAGDNSEQFWKQRSSIGHCITCIGWDLEGFILKNSWGSSYANGGYITLPYSDWKYIWEIWTIFN